MNGPAVGPEVSVGRILIIDDDEMFLRLLTAMLTTAGYEVREATDGKLGLAAYRQYRSDVVITDILMPVGEGLETIRALKELDPNVKIIAMSVTGDGQFGFLETAVAFGARRILHKPFSREQLLATLADVIAG